MAFAHGYTWTKTLSSSSRAFWPRRRGAGRAGARRSAPSAPCRTACPRSWPWPASRTSRRSTPSSARFICRPLNARFARRPADAQERLRAGGGGPMARHPLASKRSARRRAGQHGRLERRRLQIPPHPARGALRARQDPGSITTRTANWLSSTDHDDWSDGSPVRRTTPFPHRRPPEPALAAGEGCGRHGQG
jgi:hypothetical protein